MDDEFVKCIDRAEKKNDMSLVIKGNGLKRKSEAKQEALMVLEKQLDDLKVKQTDTRKLTKLFSDYLLLFML